MNKNIRNRKKKEKKKEQYCLVGFLVLLEVYKEAISLVYFSLPYL